MVETLRNRGGGKGRGARDGERERERERILIQFCTVTAPPPKVIRCVAITSSWEVLSWVLLKTSMLQSELTALTRDGD